MGRHRLQRRIQRSARSLTSTTAEHAAAAGQEVDLAARGLQPEAEDAPAVQPSATAPPSTSAARPPSRASAAAAAAGGGHAP